MVIVRRAACRALLASIFVFATVTSVTPGQELVVAAREATAATPPGTAERLAALLLETRVLQRFDLAVAIEKATAAADLAKQLDDSVSYAVAITEKASAQVGFVGPDVILATLAEGQKALPKNAPLATLARMSLLAATIHWTLDRQQECMASLRLAIDRSEEANDPATQMKANILAIGIVGWSDDPAQEAKRLLDLAQASDREQIQLEARTIHAVMKQRAGNVESAMAEHKALRTEAQRLGDRASEGFLGQTLARNYALNDLEQTHQLALESLATYQKWGHREFIAEAQHYLAQIAVFRKQPEEAIRRSEEAVAMLTGMGMDHRMLEALSSAAHIASIQGLTEKSRDFGARHTALNEKLSKQANYNERGLLWRESTGLRRSLREVQRRYQQEVEDMSAQLNRVMLATGIGGTVVLIIASILLMRSKRRLEQANEQLKGAMIAAETLQQERAALQQNLQQIERLDSIGLLAGGFAHDFNNLLVGVLGNAQLLLCNDKVDPDQHEMLNQIVQSSNRAAALCKDILAYAHAAPTPMSSIDLIPLLQGLVPLAKAGFGAGIEVVCNLGKEPCMIHGDRSQIEQVFLNILVNAGDAIADRGQIVVSIARRQLNGVPPSGHWFGEFTGVARDCYAVSVRDSGQGMNSETIRRIFDPFFSTRFAGRGIGLAAVFGILRRHQGIVEVHSEIAQGTLFTVYLPRLPVDQFASDSHVVQIPRQLPPRPAETRPGTILVVDDEATVRQVARKALEGDGHNVVTADGGHRALQLFEQHGAQIGMVLIDVTMPDMDGPTLAKQLRNRSPELAIVLMTGHAQSAMHGAELDVPMLCKPFDLNELIEVARKLTVTP
jgi:two-component system, cell cycle sensor histidine kinase and response regulator CckA